MTLGFTKVEGLGNDFVLVDGRDGRPGPEREQVLALCDRHRGVGADGVLALEPSMRAAARLVIRNADGSRSEMCGNGLRCVARYLFSKLGKNELQVETLAGVHRCRNASNSEVWVELLGLQVGQPETIEVQGYSIVGRHVRLGNPHFVTHALPLEGAQNLGPLIETHPRFAPDRTNVELCAVEGQGLRVRVWERGVGLTLACGTGAGAAAAAAWADGLLPKAATVVELPGGSVRVEPLADDRLALIGPAREVFSGQVKI